LHLAAECKLLVNIARRSRYVKALSNFLGQGSQRYPSTGGDKKTNHHETADSPLRCMGLLSRGVVWSLIMSEQEVVALMESSKSEAE